jgi:hypothetical protein
LTIITITSATLSIYNQQSKIYNQMRLNYGKTFLLGFGFFSVSLIWMTYKPSGNNYNLVMVVGPVCMIPALVMMLGVHRSEASGGEREALAPVVGTGQG